MQNPLGWLPALLCIGFGLVLAQPLQAQTLEEVEESLSNGEATAVTPGRRRRATGRDRHRNR